MYAGLSGSFGGANYQGTYEFEHEQDAMQAAFNLAVEEYQSYEGMYGLMNWNDCEEDCRESGWITDDMDEDTIGKLVDSVYNDEIDDWISYYVKLDDGTGEEEEE